MWRERLFSDLIEAGFGVSGGTGTVGRAVITI
jgi:hypothetical protein